MEGEAGSRRNGSRRREGEPRGTRKERNRWRNMGKERKREGKERG